MANAIAGLSPAPAALGLGAPQIGPWLAPQVVLPSPGPRLDVNVVLPGPTTWLPPAAGILRLYLAGTPVAAELGRLRDANHAPAFAPGSFVALFTLLPAVEARLDHLTRALPGPADPTWAAAPPSEPLATPPTRCRVRHLAIELTVPPTPAGLALLLAAADPAPIVPITAADPSLAGFRVAGGVLAAGDRPMQRLARPGVLDLPDGSTHFDRLLVLPAGPAALWAFDHRGRPIDPGAVACWWDQLSARVGGGLWARGVVQVTAPRTPGLTVSITDAHQGPPSAAGLGRLTFTTTGVGAFTAAPANPALFAYSLNPVAARPPAPLTVSTTPGPAVDPFPDPQLALHPSGSFAPLLTLAGWDAAAPWPPGMDRDFCRVALVSPELHLTGVSRVPAAATPAAVLRAELQANADTNVRVETTAPLVLLGDATAVNAATFGALGAPGVTQAVVVAPEAHEDAGPWAPLAPLPLPAAPVELIAVELLSLRGGGDAGVLRVTVDAPAAGTPSAFAGAWVRAWPLGFDRVERRFGPLDGGGGRVGADGRALLVLPLPPESDVVRLQVLVVTAAGARAYRERVLPRPPPLAGGALAWGAAAAVTITELGVTGAPAALGGAPSGASVVAPVSAGFARVTGAPVVAPPPLLPSLAALGPTAHLRLAAPPFGERVGRGAATLSGATGAGSVAELPRAQSAPNLGTWTAQWPTQYRREALAWVASGAASQVVVGAGPLLPGRQEALPHHQGHPGVPAQAEVHEAGAVLTSLAAEAASEAALVRRAAGLLDYGADVPALGAVPAFDTTVGPAAPYAWAAPLRTAAPLAEGDPALIGIEARQPILPLNPALAALLGVGPDRQRAAARLARAGVHGLQEGLESLLAAMRRAQDLVYVETPAFDDLPIGVEARAWWTVLANRLAAAPNLHVILACAGAPGPQTPVALWSRLRQRMRSALDALPPASAARVVAFEPLAGRGRPLRFAATVVVVDDVWAMAGSTHLTRRGLSFDGSLAVATFERNLSDGVSAPVAAFRRASLAARLGVAPGELPDEPPALVEAIRATLEADQHARIAPLGALDRDHLEEGSTPNAETAESLWNPDGTHLDRSTGAAPGPEERWVSLAALAAGSVPLVE